MDELLDLPIRSVSPLAGSETDGTAESGARSLADDDCERERPPPKAWRGLGGEDERMPVLEVGTGVGYFRYASLAVAWRLAGRGRPGDEESGSKGGRSVGGGRLVPAAGAAGGSVGSGRFGGDESIASEVSRGELAVVRCLEELEMGWWCSRGRCKFVDRRSFPSASGRDLFFDS